MLTGQGTVSVTAPLVAAAVCGSAAVWLIAGQEYALRRARQVVRGASAARPKEPSTTLGTRCAGWWRAVRRRPEWASVPVGVALALMTSSPVPLLAAGLAVPLLRRGLRGRRERVDAERRAEAVVELCGAVAGELRAGKLPEQAVLAVGATGLGARADSSLRASARFGGDLPEALSAAAHLPGAAGLRGVAACWQSASDGGASLAAGLDRLAAALRADAEQRAEVRALLAGPRSTAVVLALLPVFGLGLGAAMGAGPLDVLLHTPAGLACLAVGGLLECAGLAWVRRLVRSAEGGGPS